MSSLSFGLKPSGNTAHVHKKRRLAFEQNDDEESNEHEESGNSVFGDLLDGERDGSKKQKKKKVTTNGAGTSGGGTSLSALRSARLQDKQALELDAMIYDYDGVYDALAAQKDALAARKSGGGDDGEQVVPKYMSNLLASAEVRKRDQLRAREKAVQREREAEGEEMAGKEKFVTGGYKKQIEEMRRLEEEEKRKEEVEEERKKRGGGMTGFHRDLLRKEEEREKALQVATAETVRSRQKGETRDEKELVDKDAQEDEQNEIRLAAKVNAQGGHVVINDEGEIVDKRQLLSAGLNVAPSKPSSSSFSREDQTDASTSRPHDHGRAKQNYDAKLSQRERQTRMLEAQIEEVRRQAEEVERKEEMELQEKNKSKISEEVKVGARERYLARKRAQEEAKSREKETGGAG